MSMMLCNKNGLYYFFIVLVYITTTIASPVDFVRDDNDITRHKFLSDATLKGDADNIADVDTMQKKREEEVQDLDSSLSDSSEFYREKSDFIRPAEKRGDSSSLALHRRSTNNNCDNDTTTRLVCQNCAKITRAIGAYEECCYNRRNAYKWCKRIYDFTHTHG